MSGRLGCSTLGRSDELAEGIAVPHCLGEGLECLPLGLPLDVGLEVEWQAGLQHLMGVEWHRGERAARPGDSRGWQKGAA